MKCTWLRILMIFSGIKPHVNQIMSHLNNSIPYDFRRHVRTKLSSAAAVTLITDVRVGNSPMNHDGLVAVMNAAEEADDRTEVA